MTTATTQGNTISYRLVLYSVSEFITVSGLLGVLRKISLLLARAQHSVIAATTKGLNEGVGGPEENILTSV